MTGPVGCEPFQIGPITLRHTAPQIVNHFHSPPEYFSGWLLMYLRREFCNRLELLRFIRGEVWAICDIIRSSDPN